MTRRTFSFIAWVVTDWLNSYLSPAPYKCWILIFPKWNLCAYAIILCDLSPWSVKSIQQKSASEPSPIKNSRNVPLWTLLGSELLRKMLLRTCSLHGAFSISVYYIGDIWLGLHKKNVTLFRDTCNKKIIKKYQKNYYSNNYSIVYILHYVLAGTLFLHDKRFGQATTKNGIDAKIYGPSFVRLHDKIDSLYGAVIFYGHCWNRHRHL